MDLNSWLLAEKYYFYYLNISCYFWFIPYKYDPSFGELK